MKINISAKIKLDRPQVKSLVDRFARSGLMRFGAFVRRRARQSIRKPRRKTLSDLKPAARAAHKETKRIAKAAGKPPPKLGFRPSKPGEPFRDITGAIRRLIIFRFDRSRMSVVIGGRKTKAGTALAALEHGGYTRITGGPAKGRRALVQARPVLQPAFFKELPGLPAMLARRF